MAARRPMKAAKSSSNREVAILRSESTTMPTLTKNATPETIRVMLRTARCRVDVRTFSSGSSCSRPSRGVSLKLFSTKCPFFVRAASITRLKYLLMARDRGVRTVRTAPRESPSNPRTFSLALKSHHHFKSYLKMVGGKSDVS